MNTKGPKSDSQNTEVMELAQYHSHLMDRVARTQDWSAFEELFAYFGPRVKSLMLRAGADPALAEDLVQDTMTKVWRKASLYTSGRGSVSTWIFTVARNSRIDKIRRASSQPYDDIDEIEIASDEPAADDQILSAQRAASIAVAVAELPPEQRQVIELAFMQDLPQSEIASKLDVPLGTVKSRMRLAYGKLKTKLEGLR